MDTYLNISSKILSTKFYFKLLYLVTTLLTVTIFNAIPLVPIVNKVLIVWGVLLIPFCFINTYIINRKKLKLHEILIFIFLVFTFILNLIFYFSVENIKFFALNCMFLLVFFSPSEDTNNENLIKKEFLFFSGFFCILSFVLTSISIAMKLFNITLTFNNINYIISFENPNSLGLASAISILLSFYLIKNIKNKYIKISLYINLPIQTYAFALLGGRSAFILILALIFIYIFTKYKSKSFRLLISISPLIMAFAYLAKNINTLYLILTGREILWQIAAKAIKNNPFIGVGNSNMVKTLYEVGNYAEMPGIEGGGLHNIYIQITVVNGIIACIIFILILLVVFFTILKRFDSFTNLKKSKLLPLFALFTGLALVGTFESVLLYNMSFITIIFWVVTKYLLELTKIDSST